MDRHFNTTGPVHPEEHYAIDPLSRLDWEDIRYLIAAKKFFVLHARARPERPAPCWR
ncbi:MAG TPA: hypothetical protein PLB10_03480 [Thiolinea sp.]|nr:hypothetical protein [Thiolinea sp.]